MSNSAFRQRRTWTFIAAILSLLALLGGTGWIVATLFSGGATAADPVASVVGTALALAATAVSVTAWLRTRASSGRASTSDRVAELKREFARAIEIQWKAEARARSLADRQPMPVRWRLAQPELIDAAVTNTQPEGRSDNPRSFVHMLHSLPKRRLVIVGDAGAGKTTMAVQLLLELLLVRTEDEPVPILLSLADWDPESQIRLQDWLAARIKRDYSGVLSPLQDVDLRSLVELGEFFPILDGLDEISASQVADAMRSIDESQDDRSGFIVTCRQAEFQKGVNSYAALNGAIVIALRSLDPADSAAYIEEHLRTQSRPRWSSTLDEMRSGSPTSAPLRAVSSRPLGLWLVRRVYIDHDRDPAHLIDGTFRNQSELEHHLYEQLVPAIIQQRARSTGSPLHPIRQYSARNMQRWLASLAGQCRDLGTTDWAWWDLASLAFRTPVSRISLRMVLGGIISVGVYFGMQSDFGLVPSFLLALATAISSALGLEFIREPRTSLLGRARLVVLIPIAFLAGCASATFAIVQLLSHGFGLDIAVRMGLLSAAVATLTVSVEYYVEFSPRRSTEILPNSSLRLERDRTILQLVGATIVIGLPVSLTSGVTAGAMLSLGIGAAVTLPWSPWTTYALGLLAFWTRGKLPARLTCFLSDARSLGLLRIAGSSFQFRHREMQNHWASLDQAS